MNFKKAIELIQHFEGFHSKAYTLEGEKYPTIGWGRHGAHVGVNETTTEEEEYEWLIARLSADYNEILDTGVELTENQTNALLSFVYNVGINAFLDSTLLKKIKSDDPSVSSEFLRWIKSSSPSFTEGLVRRRKAERALFDSDYLPKKSRPFTLAKAARYTKGTIRHQNLAWEYLESCIDEQTMLEFKKRYRKQ